MPKISEFCDYLSHQKRYSTHTVNAYKKDLEQFNEFLISDYSTVSFKDANSSIIRSWIIQMIENDISPRSINRKISTLKSFYKHLLKNNEIDSNPLLKVTTPKTAKRLPVFVGESEITDLFTEVEFSNDYEGHRDNLILELFYATGIRLSELVNLEINSIDYHNLTIKVLGKRNKERIIPIGTTLKVKIEVDRKPPLDFKTEETDELNTSDNIINHLSHILETQILPNTSFSIRHGEPRSSTSRSIRRR